MTDTLKNWQAHTDEDNIVWLTLRYAGGSTNILTNEVMDEFKILLDGYKKSVPRGLIIMSGHSNGFIAGADIHEFLELKDSKAAFKKLRKGQEIFEQLAHLNCPTVALINGFCLGGGLELALACRYRIALNENKTRLGFPEILLGIHPGWGGCVRTPLLIGAPAALDLILSGKTVNAKKAKKIGLIDDMVPEREFTRAAKYFIMHQPSPSHLHGWRPLTNAALIRPLLGAIVRKQLEQKASSQHYPAPYAVLKWWIEVGPQAKDALEKEAKSVSELVLHPSTENLIRVYLLQERLKKMAGLHENPPQKLHVVGGGTMGGDIAVWSAVQGLHVTVYDQQLNTLASVRKRMMDMVTKRFWKKTDQDHAIDRLTLDQAAEGVKHADVIIEAIPEDLALKQKVWKSIQESAKPNALLATNTSSIPLPEIGKALPQPDRLIGIHFFNPVAILQLVEVVTTSKTNPELSELAYQYLKLINHFPLPVKSSPGFLVNRILMPYLLEAAMLLDEGIAPHLIDKAAKDFGMPMGPIEICDTVGLDVCLAVAEHLSQYYPAKIPDSLRSMVAAGKLGRKTGSGFYDYKHKKPQEVFVPPEKPPNNASGKENISIITDRIIMRLLNEACACWREKIVEDADLVDAGMVFGTGFAPFRGGPLHYAQSLGLDAVLKKFSTLETHCGERFKPDEGWAALLK